MGAYPLTMLISDFDYELPIELIAQEPPPERDSSRMLVVERHNGRFSHHLFTDLPDCLPANSLLVFNDTRVIAARLCGRKESGGRVEILLVRRLPCGGETWEVLCRGGHNLRAGSRVRFAPELWAEWLGTPYEGRGILQFFSQGDVSLLLEQLGEAPLPPYIKRSPHSRRMARERYQTVYARHPGAVAAPTAGLHFTRELLSVLQQRGIDVIFLTLHVGVGTFQPIRAEQVEEHRMEAEEYEISEEAAESINLAKAAGRTIIAVGTTSIRALESASTLEGKVQAGHQHTNLFIYPGYQFRVVDGLITNFHLPRSTLLLLVSALAGRELIRSAYAEAVARRYRFYSYGDAMLII